MANYKLKTQLSYGKYKGWKVYEIIQSLSGRTYLKWLHNSDRNVKLTDEVILEIKNLDNCLNQNGIKDKQPSNVC